MKMIPEPLNVYSEMKELLLKTFFSLVKKVLK